MLERILVMANIIAYAFDPWVLMICVLIALVANSFWFAYVTTLIFGLFILPEPEVQQAMKGFVIVGVMLVEVFIVFFVKKNYINFLRID
ncbi:MAG: hypothetical protein DRO87_11920 [Candidatus Thorarchaeota archaeon]|nr:MAG: hypothetical protein DRO87_11920 [Candidatus Thorarchaeota archaeon]